MRKWLERGFGAVIILAVIFGALHSVVSPIIDGKFQQAQAELEKSKAALRARSSNEVPAGPQTSLSTDARGPAQDNTPALKAFGERYRALIDWKGERLPYKWVSSTWSDAQWKEAEAFLAQCEPLLSDLRAFARTAPMCLTPEITRECAKGYKESWSLIDLVNLLGSSAQVSAHSGDMEAATEDIATMFQLVDTLPILGPMRGSCWITGRRALTDTFPPGALTAAQGNRLIGLAEEAIPDRSDLVQSTLAQAQMVSVTLDDPSFTMEPEYDLIDWRKRLFYRAMSSPLTRPIRLNDAAYGLDAAEEVVALADSRYYEVRGRIQAIQQRSRLSRYIHPISADAPWWWVDFFVHQVTQEAQLDLLRMGLSIELYKTEHGTYPTSLEAIAASVGGTIPLDPFTGQPYQYHVSGDTFTLYSVGENQTDDGGNGNADVVWREKTAGQDKPPATVPSPKSRRDALTVAPDESPGNTNTT